MTDEIIYGDHTTKYSIAIYFTLQTITTVGFGDEALVNNYERIFSFTMMIAGVILFSAVNGSLIAILTNIDHNSEKED